MNAILGALQLMESLPTSISPTLRAPVTTQQGHLAAKPGCVSVPWNNEKNTSALHTMVDCARSLQYLAATYLSSENVSSLQVLPFSVHKAVCACICMFERYAAAKGLTLALAVQPSTQVRRLSGQGMGQADGETTLDTATQPSTAATDPPDSLRTRSLDDLLGLQHGQGNRPVLRQVWRSSGATVSPVLDHALGVDQYSGERSSPDGSRVSCDHGGACHTGTTTIHSKRCVLPTLCAEIASKRQP